MYKTVRCPKFKGRLCLIELLHVSHETTKFMNTMLVLACLLKYTLPFIIIIIVNRLYFESSAKLTAKWSRTHTVSIYTHRLAYYHRSARVVCLL